MKAENSTDNKETAEAAASQVNGKNIFWDVETGEELVSNESAAQPKRKDAKTSSTAATELGKLRSNRYQWCLYLAIVLLVLAVIGLAVTLGYPSHCVEPISSTKSDQAGVAYLSSIKDLLIVGGQIITMNSFMDVREDDAIYIKDGIIEDIGPKDVLNEKYEDSDFKIELNDEDIVFPGLINTHGHVCMTAFGDLVDDKELIDWLFNYIFPLEGALVTEEFCTPSFTLGMSEMLQSGTTTFVDGYFFQNEMAPLVEKVGMRGVLCEGVIDYPQPDFATPEETLLYVEQFLQNWQGNDLVTPCIIPHAPYTTSPWIYKKAVELVAKYGGILSTHLSESPIENATLQEAYGVSPTEYLESNGFLTPNTILAHAVWLSDTDRNLISEAGAHIAHNPTSNSKLASGVFDWDAAKNAGINVAIGTDGPASNNDLDMIEEMRMASLLAKGVYLSPTSASAKEVLYAGTMGGAKALGREDELGSIELGKKADIAIIKRNDFMKLYPSYDPYSAIVYSSNGDNVYATIVGGKVLYLDGEFSTINAMQLRKDAAVVERQVKEKLAELEAH